jgi:hypothetical protein
MKVVAFWRKATRRRGSMHSALMLRVNVKRTIFIT